jgi:outer membrane autotransporter protein
MDTGAASGNTGLLVNNVGGRGAQTVASGILVIETQNGGSTGAGAFALAAPVVAGPYEYSLYRGAADGSAPDNWYLRSTLDSSLPDYRPEVSLYSALPAMTLLYGRQLLNTPQERLDDSVGLTGGAAHRGRWSRVIGQRGEHDGHALGIYASGPQYDYNFWAVQAGTDLFRSTDAQDARHRAGAFFAVGNAFGDVTHFDRTNAGQDNFMAYSWGGYWTQKWQGGAYVDTALLGTWYDAAGQSTRLPRMTTQGLGFGSSLEGGYPLRFASGFIVEPQAQVAYQTINLSNTSDAAAQIRFDDVNSLMGRLGVRFSRSWSMSQLFGTKGPGDFTGWLRPNLWYEFLGNPKTSFSSETGFIPFQADLFGPTLEVNAGFNARIAQDTAIFANASYLVGLGGSADGNAFDGRVGFRVGW